LAVTLRFLAKAVMMGVSSEIRGKDDPAKVRGNIASSKGIGDARGL
jgi:hypothetical protein